LDNILLNGALLGFSRSQMLGKVEQIHEFTGLREFADMPLKYYSSGMYMRLAFAIATEVNPDILLIDESLGVGDAAFQDKAKARIRNLLERTRAVVLVSHDLDSVRELCTRGLWIQQGRLMDDGPVDRVIDRYLEFTASSTAATVSR
jgi:ABC-type polysaccharide/polyol phosphate transport system ATPase subunit